MIEIRVSSSETADRGAVVRGLRAFNASKVGPGRWKAVTIVAREGRRIAGGLKGETHWDWLFVRFLWVDERARGSGLGTRLLRAAEREARRRGCRHAWLDTFDFQAPGFYRKMGYRAFGRLKDYPVRGTSKTFFTREL